MISTLKFNKVEKVFIFATLSFVVFSFVVNLFVRIESAPFISDSIDEFPVNNVAILLGASVYQNGRLTTVLEDRTITVLDLYNKGVVSKILVSGDSRTENYNEVLPVRKFLLERGVLEDDIILDYAGLDTFDTMYRAKNIFNINSAIIITQRFHLYRAIYIARSLGISAYGIPADKRVYYKKNYIREYFATIKAYYNIVGGSKSVYLSE